MSTAQLQKEYYGLRAGRWQRAFRGIFIMALFAFACIVSSAPTSAYADGGSLAIKSTSADGVEYNAVKIATNEGLPVDGNFDWSKLASDGINGETLPSYSAGKGRDLVMAVSSIVAVDEDGTISKSLENYLNGSAASVALRTNGEAVSVDDGWYLLTSTGKRSVFAWVEGEALTVGDKASIPTVEKTVLYGNEWGSTGFFGQGDEQSYRIDSVVPDSYEGYTTYRFAFHDSWDEGLSYVEGSGVIVYIHDGVETDITQSFEITSDASARTFTASAADIKAAGVSTGDTLRMSYTMRATGEAVAKPGVANTAYVTYPSFDGDGSTVKATTRIFTFAFTVTKVDKDDADKTLSGAQFAIKNSDGKWLQEDGSFGEENTRLLLKSEKDGLTGMTPGLADGDYVLVEVAAPSGYELPSNPEMPFSIAASTSGDDLELKIEGTSPISIVATDAKTSTFAMQVADNKAGSGGNGSESEDEDDGDDSDNPIVRTGDYLMAHPLVLIGAVILLLAIIAAAAIARRRGNE